jgi:glycosyltransferase involved in cell wall biosynthesis
MSRPLKVLLIVNQASHAGGAEVQLLHLARGLAANGHRVTLSCTLGSDLDPEELAGTGIELVELGIASRSRRPGAVPRLARMARRADLVHCTMWDSSLWGRLAAIVARRPVIVADHATDRSVQVAANGRARSEWIDRHNRLLDRFTYATVACASSQRPVLIGEGVSAEKLVHIPNGIPIEETVRKAASGPSRADLGLPEGKPLAIQVGTFRVEKNQIGAVEAFRALRERIPAVQLAFVGQGPTLESVRRRAEEIGAGDAIHFLGYRPDAASVNSLADVFVLPSISDAMPMTVLESMAVGVPVVASDVGDVSSLVGDTGVCVPAGDTEALARECARVLEDDDLRARLGDAARRRAPAFDSAAMVRRYEALFSAAVAGEPPIAAVAAAD